MARRGGLGKGLGALIPAGIPEGVGGLDEIPQDKMDALLGKSIHGWRAIPPPPGPNAVAGG